jgi:adenylyltransferase/sulfurtransferase
VFRSVHCLIFMAFILIGQELSEVIADGKAIVIDTRPELEFGICSIPNTISKYSHLPDPPTELMIDIPLTTILSSPETIPNAEGETVFICKKGNDSQLAATALRRRLIEMGKEGSVRDVRGGLIQWAKVVDKEFPLY